MLHRYTFSETVPIDDVELLLGVALCCTLEYHGEPMVRLGAGHTFSAEKRKAVIEVDSAAGRFFSALFATFLQRDIGEQSFVIHQLERREKLQAN